MSCLLQRDATLPVHRRPSCVTVPQIQRQDKESSHHGRGIGVLILKGNTTITKTLVFITPHIVAQSLTADDRLYPSIHSISFQTNGMFNLLANIGIDRYVCVGQTKLCVNLLYRNTNSNPCVQLSTATAYGAPKNSGYLVFKFGYLLLTNLDLPYQSVICLTFARYIRNSGYFPVRLEIIRIAGYVAKLWLTQYFINVNTIIRYLAQGVIAYHKVVVLPVGSVKAFNR